MTTSATINNKPTGHQRGVLKTLSTNTVVPNNDTTTTTTAAPHVIIKANKTPPPRKAVSSSVVKEQLTPSSSTLCDVDNSIEGWSVDEFEYIRTLGKGGTASVFLVREKQSGSHLALKVQPMDDDDVVGDDEKDGLCDEIDIHLPMDHPAIVKMIDYFCSKEKPFAGQAGGWEERTGEEKSNESPPRGYLCMILEYCDGGSLFDVLGNFDCLLSEKQAAAYFSCAVGALEYVHEQNIIHCDLKSTNFLLSTNDNKLKLADFGMAVFQDDREVVGGSPMYMAPEHLMAWRHFTDEFDHRTDIYSLGVVLFEMLVGYLPYEVIEDKDGKDSLNTEIDNKLSVKSDGDSDDDESDFGLPVLDLRKLEDASSDEPFYVPPPIFPDFVSEEAQDLIMSLMEPSPDKRISLDEVKEHAWLKKYQQ